MMYRTNLPITFLLPLALFLLLLSGNFQSVFAQDGGAPAVTTVTPNDVKDVADELWCPLCSGVRLDACELKACEQMRDVIEEKLVAGEEKQAIKDYFIAQYGPQVLGEPPMEGFNWLAWLLPVVAVLGGGAFVWYRTRGMISQKSSAPENATLGPADSEYDQRLAEELKRYD